MHDLWNAVSANRVLERLSPQLPPSTYLVGGCVRDLLLGRNVLDFDLVTFCDVWGLAKKIETLLGGKAFWIDRERCVARIAVKGTPLTVDVLSPRGPDIATDLAMRDITINAMAFDPKSRELIDPLHGQEDLLQGIIRIISEENLVDDPLRGIRCLRFAVNLGFAIEDDTMSIIRANSVLIHKVSRERIKQEIMKALLSPRGSIFFQLLVDADYGEELFHPDPEIEHDLSLRRSSEMDAVLEDAHNILPGIGDYFSQDVEQGFSRAAVLRLTAFLSGISANGFRIRNICKGLAFSSRTTRIVVNTLEAHERGEIVLEKHDAGKKSLCVLFRSYPECIPDMLLLAAASHRDLRTLTAELWDFYRTYLPQKRNPLISGKDIMEVFGLRPGLLIGKYLELVEDARLEGIITTRDEAIEYLKHISSHSPV
jgi:tRNA nucleotidyltransferase/poly(A) polymerase